ncbi:MAG: VCBS repeat-containing protein, partial [Deltaproteobacteria bacterium]|nr:VCBS repeat-containing protein [Deltaproteobacteria bacterium]
MRTLSSTLLLLLLASPAVAAVPFDAGTLLAPLAGGFGGAAGDMDGDGDIDLVIADQAADTLFLFDNDGSWTQTAIASIDAPREVELADFNRDGALDIVIAAQGSVDDVIVYLNDGTGGFPATGTVVGSPNNPDAVSVFDLQGDGDMDILYDSGAGPVRVARNDGPGAGWATSGDVLAGNNSTDSAFGDIDGDGTPDAIVVQYGSGEVHWHDPTNNWAWNNIATGLSGAYSVAPLDADRDGQLDLLVAHRNPSAGSNFVTLLTNELDTGASWTQTDAGTPATSNARFISPGDLDNDGWDDAILATQGGAIYTLHNQGGTFESQLLDSIPGSRTPLLADVDGDGDL